MRVLTFLFGSVSLIALLLTFGIGCEREVVNADGGDAEYASCFTCHGEDGYLLSAEGEWRNSIHASGNSVDYTNREGRDCAECHDHQGFLEFLETGSVSAPYDQVSAIHCFTCHSPHEKGDLTLRTDAAVTLASGDVFDHGPANLCANCHRSRLAATDITDDQVISSSHWGTHHGPQGDLLNGSNGYEYATFTYENSSHAGIYDNSGCIGCHMGQPQVHDGYMIGGHSFNMVDEESGSTLVGVCEDCHESAESFDYEGIQTEVNSLLAALDALLFDAGIVDDGGHPIPQTIADQDIAGALYNFVIVEEDRSSGVHNPKYIVDLLESSIAYMESLLAGKIAGRPEMRTFSSH